VNIERDENGGFVFSEVDLPLVQLLLAISGAADPGGNPAAQARLFPKPMAGQETDFCEEWEQFVQPELREAFEDASTTVDADLEPLRSGEEGWTIPLNHVDAWLNTLNQARLALAAEYEVTEADMDRPVPYPVQNERSMAVSQIHVYGLLQECLIQNLE
jgi:hypothetical protein